MPASPLALLVPLAFCPPLPDAATPSTAVLSWPVNSSRAEGAMVDVEGFEARAREIEAGEPLAGETESEETDALALAGAGGTSPVASTVGSGVMVPEGTGAKYCGKAAPFTRL